MKDWIKYGVIPVFLVVLFAVIVSFLLPDFTTNQSALLEKDWEKINERFDRVETGIRNSAQDICFQWGGKWLTDQNSFVTQEFEIPLPNGSFSRVDAILCIKPK